MAGSRVGYITGSPGLGALQDAISMYFGLRQQHQANDYRQQQLGLQQQDLGLRQREQQFREQEAADQGTERKQKFLTDIADAYSGQDVPASRVPEYQRLLPEALTPKTTLSSRQFSGAAPLPGDDQAGDPFAGMTASSSPGQPTGDYSFTPTSSEKYRTAMARITAGSADRAAGRQTQIDVANIRARSAAGIAERQIAARAAIAAAGQALTRYGIDTRNQTQLNTMAQLVAANTAHFTDVEHDNFVQSLRANPLAILPYIQGDAQMPPVPPRSGYDFPAPVPGGGGVGGPSPFRRVQ